MADNIFQNNPKFQTLSPEAQKIVKQKFTALSPEAQGIVRSKLGPSPEAQARAGRETISQFTPTSPVGVPGGVAVPPLPASEEEASITKSTDIIGEGVAEALAAQGTNPELAAAVGTAFQLLPETIFAVPGGQAAVRTPRAIKAGVKAIKETAVGRALRGTGAKVVGEIEEQVAKQTLAETTQVGKLKTAAEKVGSLLQERMAKLKEAGEAGIRKLQESIKRLPSHQQKVLNSANENVLNAKASIGDAEKALGIDISKVGTPQFKKLIENPKKLQGFIDKYSRIANEMGEEVLAKALDTKTLQVVRKAAETAAKRVTDDFARAELFNISRTFRNAVGKSNRLLSQSFDRFKTATDAVKSLPAQFKTQKNAFTLGLQRLKNLAKDSIASDSKLKSYQRILDILETNLTRIPRQFQTQKAKLGLALRQAKNLRDKQSTIRNMAGAGLIGTAAAGIAFSVGQKLVGR